jgi:hypothetical protein
MEVALSSSNCKLFTIDNINKIRHPIMAEVFREVLIKHRDRPIFLCSSSGSHHIGIEIAFKKAEVTILSRTEVDIGYNTTKQIHYIATNPYNTTHSVRLKIKPLKLKYIHVRNPLGVDYTNAYNKTSQVRVTKETKLSYQYLCKMTSKLLWIRKKICNEIESQHRSGKL